MKLGIPGSEQPPFPHFGLPETARPPTTCRAAPSLQLLMIAIASLRLINNFAFKFLNWFFNDLSDLTYDSIFYQIILNNYNMSYFEDGAKKKLICL